MLSLKNENDIYKMMKYYRTSDMLNLLLFFPNISPVKDLVVVDSCEDYLNNKDMLDKFMQNRVDTLKGRTPLLGIENDGKSKGFYNTLKKVKEKDPLGVLVLFNISSEVSERYERYAGITIGVNIGSEVIIEAVSKGFDGREVSKSICVHERYNIPWYDLRKISISSFKKYQVYEISNKDYLKTRKERVEFLKSLGLNPVIFDKFIPKTYQEIPDFIWEDVIKNILNQLEKKEDLLRDAGFHNFAISGHTEGKRFLPWQMFDKTRYTLGIKK